MQVFSCEFCEISKNIFFTEHLRVTAFKSALRQMNIPRKSIFNKEAAIKDITLLKMISTN